MMRVMSFILLVALFGFGGALAIMIAVGFGVLVIKLLPILLVVGLVSIILRRESRPRLMDGKYDW